MAVRFGTCEQTVKNQMSALYDKLGVSNRVELLFYLTQHGHTFDGDRQVVHNRMLS